MLLTIVGAVAGVILIVIITLSAILCQKRKRRRHHHENSARDMKSAGRPHDEKSMDGNNHTTIITNQCRDSDRSSNVSDLKLELREDCYSSNQEYSEAGSDGGINRTSIGIPMTGPVNLPGGEIYRYSADYTEPHFPPKSNVSTTEIFLND